MTLAAAGGHLDLIKLLLDLKVSVNPTHTALCPTPIIAAAFRRHTHICALLTHRYLLALLTFAIIKVTKFFNFIIIFNS